MGVVMEAVGVQACFFMVHTPKLAWKEETEYFWIMHRFISLLCALCFDTSPILCLLGYGLHWREFYILGNGYCARFGRVQSGIVHSAILGSICFNRYILHKGRDRGHNSQLLTNKYTFTDVLMASLSHSSEYHNQSTGDFTWQVFLSQNYLLLRFVHISLCIGTVRKSCVWSLNS